jgi:hypothetical protein
MQGRHQCAQAEERVTGKQDVNNRQTRRARAAHKRRLAARDTASELDESESEGADWDE